MEQGYTYTVTMRDDSRIYYNAEVVYPSGIKSNKRFSGAMTIDHAIEEGLVKECEISGIRHFNDVVAAYAKR